MRPSATQRRNPNRLAALWHTKWSFIWTSPIVTPFCHFSLALPPRPHLYRSPPYFLREHSFIVRVHPFSLRRPFSESIPSVFLPPDVRSQGRGFISQHDLHWPNLSNPLARTSPPLLCTRWPSQPHCGIYRPCFLGLERRFLGRKGREKEMMETR